MHDFIHAQGPAFLAHLLRRLADELVDGAAAWYPEAGVGAPPRTISTLLALDGKGALGVTELAALLHQSHPLVITWIRELTRLAFVSSEADPADGRRTLIVLTAQGRNEVARVRAALATMEKASAGLLATGGGDLWAALWTLERACREQPFLERLRTQAAADA
ncbi:MarR family winged helix-turn-helix transcriptional regulator [Dokdonella sp. MW10]|uniref:MarR family winged helix-turn-helix transcriptional regulator n=1 Tax=Dokdonella sp. MW10 TaxID=2992926 RepID=UPI003F7E2112